jgi:hypothetical protein
MVIYFLKHLSKNAAGVKLVLVDKVYALVCKMVDMVVEEGMAREGIDLYERGGNITLSNMMYHVIPSVAGRAFFDQLLTLFQAMVRQRTHEAYDGFFRYLFEYRGNEIVEPVLDLLRASHSTVGYSLVDSLPKKALDVSLTAGLNMMAEWRKEIDDDIVLIHDQSSNMADQKELWEKFMDPGVPEITIGYDRRTMKLPIAVKDTRFEPSENWAGLQLSDIVVGAAVRVLEWFIGGQSLSDNYAKMLADTMDDHFRSLLILPSRDVTSEAVGCVGSTLKNPIEVTMDIVRGRYMK